MKVLQLVSDWKWTGPAEPMLVLSRALRARGHQVDLVCPETPPGANRSLWQEAEGLGISPIETIPAGRSALRSGDADRVAQLREWIAGEQLAGPYDVVQCWHSRDHVLAARALGLGLPTGRRGARTRLVRFLSSAERVAAWPWNRWLLGPACDGLVCVSESSAVANRRLRGGRPIVSTTGAIDLDALAAPEAPGSVRARLGLHQDDLLVGVVARMQPHRRFDVLLGALSRLAPTMPRLRLVLIGRGTRVDAVVRTPARALGLEDRVVFAGYRNRDYGDVLAAMDLICFLVPGSDGTCRALLQGAALGLPMVGSRRGAIPEIISNGQTGLLVDEEPEAVAGAWSSLLTDPSRRRTMGAAARRDAQQRFSPDRFAARMERFYEALLDDLG